MRAQISQSKCVRSTHETSPYFNFNGNIKYSATNWNRLPSGLNSICTTLHLALSVSPLYTHTICVYKHRTPPEWQLKFSWAEKHLHALTCTQPVAKGSRRQQQKTPAHVCINVYTFFLLCWARRNESFTAARNVDYLIKVSSAGCNWACRQRVVPRGPAAAGRLRIPLIRRVLGTTAVRRHSVPH